MSSRRTLAIIAITALAAVRSSAAADPIAPDVRQLVRCQRALDGAGMSILVGRAERLGRCLDGWVRCGASADRDPACEARAVARCALDVAALARDQSRVVAAITRRCARVDVADVLAPGRLGYASRALACGPVDDAEGAACCAAWTYGCQVAALLGDVPPELDGLLAVDAGCAAGDDAAPPAVDSVTAELGCERGVRRARAGYARAVLPALGRCVEHMLACEVGEAACATAATRCARQHTAVVHAAGRFTGAVVEACGHVAAESAATPACIVGHALRDASPRAEDLLGRTALALDAAGCAPIAAMPTPMPTAAGGASPTTPATFGPTATATPRRSPVPTRTRTPVGPRTATPTPTVTVTPVPAAVVRALVVDPGRPSTVYAGLDVGGVFQSLDGAASWTALVAGLTDRAVRALVVDPQHHATLYAGTASGVFRSDDGAGSWTRLSAGLSTRDVQALAIDPAHPATLYAGTNGGGVFRSDDGAGSWTPLSAGITVRDVRALAVDPARPATLYAGTNGGGVFRSDDQAGSWSSTSLGASFAAARAVRALAIDPARPATLYAGTDGGGVFKSEDGGATWAPTSLATSFPTGRAVRALAVDRLRPTTLYAGTDGGGVFKSEDGGATWTITALVGSFAGAASVQALALDPSNTALLYAGTAVGAVFKSTDGGAVWSLTSAGLPARR